ncbi:SGNH/GDSL hydrolase family protein [Sutcliffiella halmapala]|uniref:SGNH/GDSL hydrolase family protein n=1 Tax=Sutcliffiella halmapala TaxID=79882 RepID=UPI0009951431|nr:SGNH/GDSL hydrolase family protein [Sutcliffiella halmapala]
MQPQKRLVFIGDSITESGRFKDTERMGSGYVKMIYDYLVLTDPSNFPNVINRGISGNRITDLQSRWDEDVIKLNPDYVSISIGVNDVWRQLDNPELEQVSPERFESIYRELLTEVNEKTNAVLFLMEPTIIEENIESPGNIILKEYVDIVQQLAIEYDSILVPTHQSFLDYLRNNPIHALTTDGVHMNDKGNLLMAKTWVDAVKWHLK